ncbi:hypothetical protein ACFLZ2_00375 [Candidatus Margulisiibacteriota bacterium]
MKEFVIMIIFVIALSGNCSSVTLKNIPFDSSFHMGITSGLGLGVDFGVDVEFPFAGYKVGVEVEQLVTNINYEQNVNTAKFGLMYKYGLWSDFYLTFHAGFASFYLPKTVNYIDLYTGQEHTLPGDYQGRLSYWGVGLNYMVEEYIVTPKISFNTVGGGGTLLSIDLNVGHAL